MTRSAGGCRCGVQSLISGTPRISGRCCPGCTGVEHMSANQVLCIERDGLATVSLNKPEKLNALDTAVFEELLVHIERIEASAATIGCVVLRGNGRSFCAGHDLAVLTAGESVAENLLQTKVIERLANLPQPVITA